MKKKTIIFLICYLLIIPYVKGQVLNQPYEFPLKPGMPEWKNFKTGKEMSDALMIPTDILKNLSTEALVETCLDYPMFGSIILANDLQTGFEKVTKYFNGLQELLKREDACKVLIKKYEQINPEQLGFERFEYRNTVYVYIYIELILAQEDIISSLLQEERNELLKISLRVLDEKQKYPMKFSLFVQETSYLLMARLLKFEKVNFIEDDSTLENQSKINLFINYCILTDPSILDLILEEATTFLGNQ